MLLIGANKISTHLAPNSAAMIFTGSSLSLTVNRQLTSTPDATLLLSTTGADWVAEQK